jgi:hypothetical protein
MRRFGFHQARIVTKPQGGMSGRARSCSAGRGDDADWLLGVGGAARQAVGGVQL